MIFRQNGNIVSKEHFSKCLAKDQVFLNDNGHFEFIGGAVFIWKLWTYLLIKNSPSPNIFDKNLNFVIFDLKVNIKPQLNVFF